jgi:hypothetical protein
LKRSSHLHGQIRPRIEPLVGDGSPSTTTPPKQRTMLVPRRRGLANPSLARGAGMCCTRSPGREGRTKTCRGRGLVPLGNRLDPKVHRGRGSVRLPRGGGPETETGIGRDDANARRRPGVSPASGYFFLPRIRARRGGHYTKEKTTTERKLKTKLD